MRDVANKAGLEPDDVVHDYSGRGMHGATCFALYVDDTADVRLLAHFGLERPQDACCLADIMRCDQLGHKQVVYFPGWALTAVESSEC